MSDAAESEAPEAVPQAETPAGSKMERHGGINPLRILLWLCIGILGIYEVMLWQENTLLQADVDRLQTKNAAMEARFQAMQHQIDMLERRMPIQRFQIPNFPIRSRESSTNKRR